MKQLGSWFKQAVATLIDPDKESRVQLLVQIIQQGIQQARDAFSISDALKNQDYTHQDLQEAKERVFRLALNAVWNDGVLTVQERQYLTWLTRKLSLDSEAARRLELELARQWFGTTLALAMEDGILDQAEQAKLEAIARAVGVTLPQFARAFFQNEGEAFLRSIFLACVADNQISQSDWDYLLHVTQKFGLQHHEMLAAIQPQARQFVERVLCDAKSDGMITPQEQATLDWLQTNLGLPADFRRYIGEEIQLIKTLTAIDEGRLPSISPPQGTEFRSGEIFHWTGAATWREHKLRKDGLHSQDHAGMLVLSDNRLIFTSTMKSQSINFRKIVAHRGGSNWVELQVEGKPLWQFYFQTSEIAYPILRTAIAMANQTKVAKIEAGNSRHIPRDVRQRVWQRYGARCAECTATDYLEFDHIIPVAKGGSNTDANVQLLCRKCNLKKSDMI